MMGHVNKTSSLVSLLLIAFCAIMLMSIVPIIIKWIQVNEITIGIVRLAIGAIGVGTLLLFRRRKVNMNRQQLLWLVLLGIVFAVHWYTYFLSINMTDASLAAIGVSTFGIHLLLLSSVINRKKLTLIDLCAVAVSMIGIYLASPEMNFGYTELNGFLISILSGFLYACLPLINQKISSLSTNVRAFGQFGFALLCFSVFYSEADFEIDSNAWFGLIILGVVSTFIAHTLWIKASTELPANITSVIYYGYVPMTMLLSYLLLNETMNWQKLAGAFLIIFANIMVILFHHSKTNPYQSRKITDSDSY